MWAVTTAAGVGIMDAVTGRIDTVVELDAPAQALGWSPGGRTLAWSEEGRGVGVLDVARGEVRRHEAHSGAVDHLSLSEDGRWVVGVDDHGHLLGWTADLTESVFEDAGEGDERFALPVVLGEKVVQLSGAGVTSSPLPVDIEGSRLAAAAAVRTPWRACARDGSLALLPDVPGPVASQACASVDGP